MPTPLFSGGRFVTSSSPKKILPLLGFSRPQIRLSVVLFPQPDGPSSPTRLPSGTSNVKSLTAITSLRFFLFRLGNFLVRFCNTIFIDLLSFVSSNKIIANFSVIHKKKDG